MWKHGIYLAAVPKLWQWCTRVQVHILGWFCSMKRGDLGKFAASQLLS
jgi:hypothetical protein